MQRLSTNCIIVSLLLATAATALAGSNLNSTKSNAFRVVYDTTVVGPAQASAILSDLGKTGRTIGAGVVAEIVERHGVKAESIRKIVILPTSKPGQLITVILLANPADEAQALKIAVSDPGASGSKPKK